MDEIKTIEVLFKEIDCFNTKIKCADNLDIKYFYAERIGDVVNAIKSLGRYRYSDKPISHRFKDESYYI